MGEEYKGDPELTFKDTPTWAVALVCFVLLAVSISIEHVIHFAEKWLKNRHKRALVEALEKIKAELMLLGFISLLLTVLQEPISGICIPKNVAATWHPCEKKDKGDRKLLQFLDPDWSARRSLATKGYDKCTKKGEVALMSAYAIHQLHIFIFVLAVFHVLYCITTLALGSTKMRKWKVWEEETKTLEYQYSNDPERFRFAKDTSFGRRHLNFWSQSSVSLWIVCFFRQFFRSVTKVDYLTLRHGFIVAHLTPESVTKFDFQKYISRSLEKDFTTVVEISPIIWFFAVLFLLSNAYGSYSYLWLPFIPLIIILLVGTKLQVIITKMGLRIQERGGVVMGTPLVQPGDELFWFGRPRLLLFLIHFVLFQNAFQLAFFAWSTYEYGLKKKNCFHKGTVDIVIRISMGVIIQVLCSYVTLPLYALVTQMGSNMKPTIFKERVATALRTWHHTARKKSKHGLHSEGTTPFSSRPATPTHGMSPVHLLHNYNHSSLDSLPTSPRKSDFENENENDQWDPQILRSRSTNEAQFNRHFDIVEDEKPIDQHRSSSSSTQLPPASQPIRADQHEVGISLSDFSFRK